MRSVVPVSWAIAPALAICALHSFAAAGAKAGAEVQRIDPAKFRMEVTHPYFPLVPGTTFGYRETEHGKSFDNEVTVTREVRVILGVTCVVVHDVLRDGNTVKEDTFDWYAQDKEGNVWYFGEASREISPHGKVSTEGSWEAGVKGAQPGIAMPAVPVPGPPYRQEFMPGEAEDMGQVEALEDSVIVPFGSFTGCLRTSEWSKLESGTEKKWYAKGVGLVRTRSDGGEMAVLVSVTKS